MDECEHVTSQGVCGWIGRGERAGLFAAAAGERVDDLVGLVLDGRLGLIALALVLQPSVAADAAGGLLDTPLASSTYLSDMLALLGLS
jgi:hypothetical protein